MIGGGGVKHTYFICKILVQIKSKERCKNRTYSLRLANSIDLIDVVFDVPVVTLKEALSFKSGTDNAKIYLKDEITFNFK